MQQKELQELTNELKKKKKKKKTGLKTAKIWKKRKEKP